MIKKLYKFFKRILLVLISLILLLIISGLIWHETSPQFGGEISELKNIKYKKTGHYKDGIFINKTTVNMDMPALKMVSIMIDFIKEFWEFLRIRKKYWLMPIIFVLTLFGILIVLSQGSVVAPFIYTIF